MKKIITLILVLFSLFATSFTFGCTIDNTTKNENNNNNYNEDLSSLKCGFSCYNELHFFDYSEAFYKGALNKDKQYITEGDSSAKFIFKGDKSYVPTFKIYSRTKFFGSADFTKVQAMSIEVFNPGQTDHSIWILLTTSQDGNKRVYQNYTEQQFVVKPGYNLLVYSIDRTVASSICDMKHVEYITFRFKNEAEEYSLYLDNLRAHYTNEEIEKSPKVYEENELLLFDNPLDRYYITTQSYMCKESEIPTVSICRNPRYVYDYSDGKGSLQIDHSTELVANSMRCPCFVLSGDPINRINFSEYSKLTFKYMANYDDNWLYVRFNNQDGVDHMIPGVVLNLTKDVWHDIEIDLNGVKNGKVYFSGFGEGIDTEHIISIDFFFVTQGAGHTFYIDDLKLIK